ncbi:MAG TPA: tRNA (adenosine(37)-N6)-dimethylallyltransferase MiaA [Gemmatimonadaceae bacterium]|nr:tRNA (adenosine(37)-N6)-dimethylallyltransferase MiaA [Gemmatimonadaceae bacterium]
MDDSDAAPPVVRVICGPTAAGKTYAAALCARFAEVAVISADSRQVYRGFDVGTAKPTVRERLAAPHYGIDVLDPTERASAAWWATEADGWIRGATAQGRMPIVVGGTGLYLRALFGELFDEPPMDPERRRALQRELEAMSVQTLRRWVEVLDPPRAALGRTQLLRAIEVALLTGRRVSELQRERRTVPRWRARYLVVDPGPELQDHIADRADFMLSTGWQEEVRALMTTVPADAPAWNASGYRVVRELVEGRISFGEARERVIIETRQYAKRQRTWFRHQLGGADVTRLDVHAVGFEQALRAWWEGSA